ncbi:MAG: OmpA family protein [Bacteroidales bacterium]|nr:OmpA family protein [Bacteroidales bacterium]
MKKLVTAIVIITFASSLGAQTNDFKTYSNYDFVAGNKVLFFDNFSSGSIGDFPVMWQTNGSGEIVTIDNSSERWFMMNNDGLFYLNEGLNVPENFTIEMDVIVKRNDFAPCQVFLTLFDPEKNDLYPGMYVPGKSGIELNLGYFDKENDFQEDHDYRVYNNSDEIGGITGRYTKPEGLFKIDKVSKLCIWVQKTRLRLYIDNVKVFDIQRAFSSGAKVGQIRFGTQDVCKILITNFRVADATEDARSKFLTDGKLVSYGIYFDSGKDIVKPQSYGAIKEMAAILTDNTSLKVLIVGHTDSDGDNKMNLDLSKRRAENVKKVLMTEFKIDASRITSDGKGETEPIAENNSAENKAKNRRVEFIKQ